MVERSNLSFVVRARGERSDNVTNLAALQVCLLSVISYKTTGNGLETTNENDMRCFERCMRKSSGVMMTCFGRRLSPPTSPRTTLKHESIEQMNYERRSTTTGARSSAFIVTLVCGVSKKVVGNVNFECCRRAPFVGRRDSFDI